VLFKRYESSPGSGIYTEVRDNGNPSIDNIPTFDVGCYKIQMNNLYNPAGYGGWGFVLPNNIFGIGCRDIVTGDDFYNNTFGDTCYSNTFGENCHDNIFDNSAFFNDIGNDFYSNRVGGDFKNNHITNGFRQNFIGDSFKDNHISSGFRNNVISNGFQRNTIEFDFTNPGITIGLNFSSNTIGNFFQNNIAIGDNFQNNNVGDNFIGNDIGDDFINWFLQNNFTGSTIPSSSQNYTVIETLGDGFVTSDKGYLKNTDIITESGGTLTVNGNLDVTGNTTSNGLTANTISASTYQNLPIDPDTYVTGFTYSDNTLVIKQNNGQPDLSQTINSVTGWTVDGGLTADTININQTPNTNTTEDAVLVRNSTTGEVEQRTIASLINANNTITVGLTGSSSVDFNSIKDAVDSITGATSANTYTVQVAGGVYYEDPFVIPSWVSVVGESSISTIIQANDSSQTLINLSDQSAIFDCQVQGCTDTNVSAIVYSSSTTSQSAAISYVENVRFGENYTHAKVVAYGGANIIMQCSNVKYGGYPFTIGFYATNSGSGVGRMQLRNVTSTNGGVVTTPGLIFAKADASNCGFIVNGCLLTKATAGGAAGTGFYVENGGFLRLTAVNFQRWAVGIDAPQIGSAPSIDAIALNFENNTIDVNIAHSGATGKIQGTDNFLKTLININSPLYEVNQDPREITVAKKGGDFSSIFSAVDYLINSGNTSQSNRFIISVGPGVFIEPEIDLTSTPYVSIVGSNIQTTQIVPKNSSQHIIKIGQNNEISFLSLSGAGAGYAAVYAYDIGDFGQLHKISIYDCDTGLWIESDTQDTKVYGEYVDMNGEFTYGTKSIGNNGYLSLANMENYYLFPTSTGGTIGNYVTGTGATINVTSSTIEGFGSSGSTAFLSQDGGFFNCSSTDVTNWDYGLRLLNVGDPSKFEFNGVTFTDNTQDISVEQSSAFGLFQGISNHEKVTTISDNVYWSFLDGNDGELDITRKASVTFTDGSHTDFTTLVFEGGPMGVMNGGQITVVSALTINTEAGYGYLTKSDNSGIVRRIDWIDTTLTLTSNSDLYIFINENGILSSSGSRPSSTFNIIMGRVVTNSTTVEFIDLSPVNAEHMANRYGGLLRNAIGPIYSTGSIVTENVTPFHLNVSQGEYYYASNEFMPSGGTDITFTQYYRNGLGGWITSATTLVNNTSYDGNGSLSALTTSYFTKHTLYLVGQGTYEKYFLVLGQNEYSTLVQAEDALLPTPPTFFTDSVTQVANIYIQQGTTGITQIEDIRPVIGFKAGGVNASSVHGNLLGLTADDHLQYLRVDGFRAMSGNLNMGGNNIVSAGTVNGVTVESHAMRHQFGGSDPVGTVTPSANAIPFADVNGKLDSWITPITISGGTGIVTGGTYPNFTLVNSSPDQTVTISGGTGITTGGTYPNFTLVNSLPDQTVSISGGTGITTGGTYPNFTLVNSAPDQTVTISGGTGIVTGGTYPNFTLENTSPDQTVTISGGTGIVTGGTYPNFTLVNSAPDQTVVLNNGTAISTSGTYPNFTISNTAPDQIVTISGGTGITTGGTYPNFTLVNSAPDQTVVVNAGSGISISGTYPNFTITYTGTSGGAGSSIFTASTTTLNSSVTTLQTITGITDNGTSIIEVYVKAYQSSATNWGVWKRTLSVTKVSGTVTIQEENADVDKQSSGLSANSLSFSVSGGDILVSVTGIAATTINWTSAYDIVI
jgi:hypothetical protein